ncbi:MAG: trehalose-phosphatase [Chlorobi bacterium]|nr:trehalose-phosphatase [Chlorobiota bacterium]
MNILKLVLAIAIGLALGGIVNMALVAIGGYFITPPAGADMSTAEGIRAALPQLEARHYLFPFLAHALGTLVGAFVAVKITWHYKQVAALAVGGLFFVGGVIAARMIPAPTWFIALDLIAAYFPFAWLGYIVARYGTRSAADVT